MAATKQRSVWSYVSVLAATLGLLTGGTWFTVKMTTDHLLYQDATNAAENWGKFLAANVSDLEQIAAGETPSSTSLAFFNTTQKSREVFRYVIFNRYGYSILVSNREKVAVVDLSDYNAVAARSIKENRPIVDAKSGQLRNEPAYYSEAYVPVTIDGQPVAVVAAYVDQTAEHGTFYQAFLVASGLLCLLISCAFAIPAIAWFRRTREKQQADRRIQFLAHHDVLTGLANRARLTERLDSALAALPPTGGAVALHFIDIDRFKEVNDTLGHDGGDFLLRTIGERLRELSRADDLVARLGGDEFVVVQTGITGKEQAAPFANRIASILAAPMTYKEENITPTFTIGVALASADEMATPDRLLKNADLALYNGKATGRNCIRFFTPVMDEALRSRLALERTIRDAITNEHLVLHYQPMYEISERKLIGFEALIRLPGPDGALIPPSTFIPLAEEMHLIGKIGQWVLREACRTAAKWPGNLTIAVNLSPAEFESGTVVDSVVAALRDSGLGAHRLELEITETLLLTNNEETAADLKTLKAMGISIVMDDFGTGYSSLSYLWKFPFDKIKIDRGFMDSFEEAGGNVETVVKSIIALAREMRMRVTVEGVETLRQVNFLHNADADQVQGFYFGKPVPGSELTAEILANPNKSAPRTRAALEKRRAPIAALA